MARKAARFLELKVVKLFSNIRWLFIVVLPVLVLASVAVAQKAVTPFSRYSHDVWRTKEGLPQNSVQTIIQSHDGYIWFGTQEGLVRFDGVRFVVFDKRNTPGLTSNFVISLCEAGDSSIWIGTDGGGVTRMRGREFTPFTVEDGLPSNAVRSIVSDREGTLWFGTSDGIARMKNGKITPLNEDAGLTYSWINSLLVDRQGMLWVGTNGGGLSRLVGGRSPTSATQYPLCGNVIMGLHEDRSEGLWIGAEKGTLTRVSGGTMRTFTLPGVRGVVSAILQDREGVIWIGTEDGVLAQFIEPDSLIYFARSGGTVSSLFEDKEGNLWVGRLGGGLHRLKQGKFTTYTAVDGLANDFVQVLCADRDGSVWIGTMGGLSRFSQNTFASCPLQDGPPIEGIMALHSARDGSLWIGTSDGLLRFKGGKIRTLISSTGTLQNPVRGIDEDRSGNLWLATRQGLLFSPFASRGEPHFVPYGDNAGTLREPLMCVHATHRGDEVWLSTVASGLMRIALNKSGNKTTRFTMQDGLSTNAIRSMYEDEDGTMWFGSFGRGLNRFKDGKFTAYSQEKGLFDDNVFAIVGDRNGNLWMSCNRGVFRVSKRDLDGFAEGRAKAISCVSYGTADGMRTFECNGGSQPSGCMSKDGRLWFATLEGAAVIDPTNLEP
ncbi:MAG TPA: hypothetical protein DGH68_11650, partial [Bacteroidetes bacterium]|nr:hypothetical protein [Bacteroidota bacterium]